MSYCRGSEGSGGWGREGDRKEENNVGKGR